MSLLRRGSRRAGLRGRFLLDDALAFFDGDELVGRDVRHAILRAARPFDLERGDGRVLREPERNRQIALRRVARPAAADAPLLAAGALDANDGADAVFVRLCADGANAEEVVLVAAVVAVEKRGTVVGRQQDVEVAVSVVVGVGGAARDDRPLELRTDGVARVL